MPDTEDKTIDLALTARTEVPRFAVTEMIAAALSVIWVVAVVVYVLNAPEGSGLPGLVMTLLVVFLPLALIWAAVTTLRSVRELRAEAARLQATVDAMRTAYVNAQRKDAAGMRPSVEKKLDDIARQTETALASFSTRRDAALTQPSADRKAALVPPPPPAPAEEQPGLALGTPAESMRPPLSVADFIRALQFPENPDDREGFRALRLALEDRDVAKLIRAAQDVLTLMSQEGIYMDDLRPDRARPELWRRFAAGERGRGIAAIGGVRDRSSLALTAGRMREDPVFRDAGHHFLRTFDRMFQQFEKNATDAEISELADTRTARAFMLFGRVMGVFD
ncbi:hypothetical protein [Pseudorhodobacter sp. MZDSW-24AT]|uniref:hypothetical protein n=1 Tax=Pseudorhodobacter sp. MZDSW-24AT TaxID=2052957 RepID=UPI000C1E991F|nr:hypothetical protein [Pseudorhodobacter sp. MZDSW-24AT]PJF09659.1 hypothetical protein CUR21_07095 [Pseudorhodobacter sp. MZDSW-24AT]